MKWLEVSIETSREYEDYVSDVLYSLGAKGLTIEDPRDAIDLLENENDNSGIIIDEKFLNRDDDELVIKAYYSESNDIEAIKTYVLERVEKIPYMQEGKRYGLVDFNLIDDRDWSETWKQFYKPTRVGENLIIKPTWEEYDELEDDIIIELDPGMAFGTGTHETTMMCGAALEKYLKKGDFVYDVGCGSGILSIIAVKLGASSVMAIDVDPTCIDITNENTRVNEVEDKILVKEGNLLDVVDEKADLVVANIIAEIIVDLVADLNDYLKIGGIFITSGIIRDKSYMVEEALKENDFEILEKIEMGEWISLVARR